MIKSIKELFFYNRKYPVWIMRQAGRYLPEYLEVRKRHKNFLSMCFDPKTVLEITLQPITRFNFDAAILFSDILVIPHALDCRVEFFSRYRT